VSLPFGLGARKKVTSRAAEAENGLLFAVRAEFRVQGNSGEPCEAPEELGHYRGAAMLQPCGQRMRSLHRHGASLLYASSGTPTDQGDMRVPGRPTSALGMIWMRAVYDRFDSCRGGLLPPRPALQEVRRHYPLAFELDLAAPPQAEATAQLQFHLGGDP